MSMQFKIDILKKLKEAGYSTYRIRKDKLLDESTLQKFRKKEPVSWATIETICKLLNLQPGDIMEYVPDEKDGEQI